MIQYKGKIANTVKEALDLFDDDINVYIGANYDPFVAWAGYHDKIPESIMRMEVFGYKEIDKNFEDEGGLYRCHYIDLYL